MTAWNDKLRAVWPLMLGQGVVLVLLGLAAMILPSLAGMAIAILVGFFLTITALADAIITILEPHRPGFWWSLASDGLGVMVGALLFLWTDGGLITLSLALAAFLILDGGIAIMLSLEHRRSGSRKWTWLWINGALDIVLAAVILLILPQSQGWALGLIVGADFLFAGITLVAMALDERGQAHRHAMKQKTATG